MGVATDSRSEHLNVMYDARKYRSLCQNLIPIAMRMLEYQRQKLLLFP